VFHVHINSVTRQAQRFRFRRRVAGQQSPWSDPKRPKRVFLQLSIPRLMEVPKFKKTPRSQSSRRVVLTDISNV
jgi:hypothetical protein